MNSGSELGVRKREIEIRPHVVPSNVRCEPWVRWFADLCAQRDTSSTSMVCPWRSVQHLQCDSWPDDDVPLSTEFVTLSEPVLT